jgi:capsular polysaccharide biosynthesis protein
MKKAIVIVSRQNEWLNVFSNLQSDGLLKPVYWITYSENHEDVAKCFPDTVLHPRIDANRGIPASSVTDLYGVNNHGINFFNYSKEINLLVDQIDRIDIGESMVLGQKRRLADMMISYWLNVILKFEIDIGIFGQPPHALGNYSLYIALMILNKEIRVYRYTGLNNFHFISERIDDFPANLDKNLDETMGYDNPIENLSLEVRTAIDKIRVSQNQFEHWYIKDNFEREKKYEKLKAKIKEQLDKGNIAQHLDFVRGPFLEETKVRTASNEPYRILSRNFKVPGRELWDEPITAGENKVYKIWSYGKKEVLQEKYNSLVSEQLPENFVFFALNYQPERTTNPDGGLFYDHYRCFLILDGLLADDYKIVIKEHPNQYKYVGMGERCRWLDYYNDFMKSERCVFVPTSLSSHNIVLKAKATATITGMVGWETLLMGKPVFTFGATWYEKCFGVLNLSNPDCNKSIVNDFLKMPFDVKKVDAFALALERICKKVYTTPTNEKGFAENIDITVNLYELLKETLC